MLKFLICLVLALHLSSSLRKNMDGKIYKVFGVDFPKFLRAHPVSLFVLYDQSPLSQSVVELLPALEAKLSEQNVAVTVAKMSTKDAPSYSKLWNAHTLPHLRLYIGDGVYDDLRIYPTLDNIFSWIATIIANDDTIRLINSDRDADIFNEEPFAFYLRFPEEQTHYLNLLKKFQKLDSRLRVYYANKAIHDPFESYNPKQLVVGIRRTFDDGNKFLASEKKINAMTVQNFFEHFRHPELHMLTAEVVKDLNELNVRSIIFFDKAKRSDALKQFKRAAGFYSKSMRFVAADLNETHAAEYARLLRVDLEGELPQVRIIDALEGQRRVFAVSGRNEEEIANAIEAYNNGELVNLLEHAETLVTNEL
jgi:hypothetical protein